MQGKMSKVYSNYLGMTRSAFKETNMHRIFKDVRANCFCACLLRTQIHVPHHA